MFLSNAVQGGDDEYGQMDVEEQVARPGKALYRSACRAPGVGCDASN